MTDRPAGAALPGLKWAVVGVFALGLATRLVGLAREGLTAARFGTSPELDAVFLALSFPIAVAVATGGGLARAVVPIAATLAGPECGGLLRTMVRRVGALAAFGALLIGFTAGFWAPFLVVDRSDIPVELVRQGAMLAALAVTGGSLAGLLVGFANARGRHFSGSFNPVVYNLVIIASILVLGPSMGPLSLLAGVVVAEWVQLAVLLPAVAGIWKSAGAAPAGAAAALSLAFVPSALLGLSSGLNSTVDRIFAGTVGPGTVSALSYADRLLNLPVGLVGMALATPIYTRLAAYQSTGNREAFNNVLALGLCLTLATGTPIAILTAGLAEPAIALLLGRGAFSMADAARAGDALRGYAPAIVFLSMMPLLYSAAFALGLRWRAVAFALGGVGLNALLDWFLAPRFGIFGIAAATTIVSGSMAFFLISRFRIEGAARDVILSTVFLAWLLLPALMIPGLLFVRVSLGESWATGMQGQVVMLLVGGVAACVPPLVALRWIKRWWGRVSELRMSVATDRASAVAITESESR